MAASLLRLHFHDCFAKGCDASLLLDSTGNIISEKLSNSNKDSARGFEVIDEIKAALEKECPETVSCADVLALAARDSVVIAGGPYWEVPLGRRDSRDAGFSESNNNIPAPNNTFNTILAKFLLRGLDLIDLVTLYGKFLPPNFKKFILCGQLRTRCPIYGGDQNLFFLDYVSPTKFDNGYYKNLLASRGLLNSDQVLFTRNFAALELVKLYTASNDIFFDQFTKSIVKMGNISPLIGFMGEIERIVGK
ncbi:unnamed protein product [Withania somnifera]